jgi:hypothetical protein
MSTFNVCNLLITHFIKVEEAEHPRCHSPKAATTRTLAAVLPPIIAVALLLGLLW